MIRLLSLNILFRILLHYMRLEALVTSFFSGYKFSSSFWPVNVMCTMFLINWTINLLLATVDFILLFIARRVAELSTNTLTNRLK